MREKSTERVVRLRMHRQPRTCSSHSNEVSPRQRDGQALPLKRQAKARLDWRGHRKAGNSRTNLDRSWDFVTHPHHTFENWFAQSQGLEPATLAGRRHVC
jgi:hypothetical protein